MDVEVEEWGGQGEDGAAPWGRQRERPPQDQKAQAPKWSRMFLGEELGEGSRLVQHYSQVDSATVEKTV